MRLLLDSNIVVPLGCEKLDRLGAQVYLLLNVPSNEIFVSVASVWEIAIKVRLGKLMLKSPRQQLPDMATSHGYALVSVDPHQAVEDLLDTPDTRDPLA